MYLKIDESVPERQLESLSNVIEKSPFAQSKRVLVRKYFFYASPQVQKESCPQEKNKSWSTSNKKVLVYSNQERCPYPQQ
jgi:hypothetical protein